MSATPADRIDSLSRDAERAHDAGRLGDAQACLEQALELAARERPSDDDLVVDLLNRIGVIGKFSGEYERAHEAYASALALERSRSKPRVDTIATVLHNIGGLAHARLEVATAAATARAGLALRRQVHGSGSAAVAVDEGALAAILLDMDELDEAFELATRAHATLAACFGDDDHDAVAGVAVIATVHHRRGDFASAATAYAEVIRARERLLGPAHPHLVPTLNNIGVLYAKLGRLDEAAAIYKRALRILDGARLPSHPYRTRLEQNAQALDARGQTTTPCSAPYLSAPIHDRSTPLDTPATRRQP